VLLRDAQNAIFERLCRLAALAVGDQRPLPERTLEGVHVAVRGE
jgi:hypothetical protein